MALSASRSSLLAALKRTVRLSPVPTLLLTNSRTGQLVSTRPKTTKSGGYSPLNDPSPNWSNRPPKETILLDGCDYEHWLIVVEFPNDAKPSEDQMIDSYVKTLASVVGR